MSNLAATDTTEWQTQSVTEVSNKYSVGYYRGWFFFFFFLGGFGSHFFCLFYFGHPGGGVAKNFKQKTGGRVLWCSAEAPEEVDARND